MMHAPQDDDLAGLVRLLREHAQASVPVEVELAGQRALARRLRLEAEAPPARRRSLWVLGGAVAIGAAVALFVLRFRPLTYEVRGARSDGPYVSAPATTPVTVAFSDGSSIEATPGSRLRVDEQRVAGARVLVERG
ncbi:MAG TPA: hypothetical protein VGQ57_13180, partial [Polyangiaceae bacterium]|nr:hypothetical protein [Polyangiaceae bacterium]